MFPKGTKITGKLLFKLLLELRNTGNPQMIKEATERFAYGINTSWSRMLANCIRISAESGINVALALEDIQIQLREARLLFEERKRLNSESARMVVFLAPVMYAWHHRHVGKISGNVIWKTPKESILHGTGISAGPVDRIFLFLINLALIEIINNQRFDY